MAIRVQILYSEGCQHTHPTLSLVRSIAKDMKLDIDLEMIPIESESQAKVLDFIGSPTVRINGKDVDSETNTRETSAFS